MKQEKLKLEPKASDRECAEIIKADPAKYPSVLMQEFAERVLSEKSGSTRVRQLREHDSTLPPPDL